MIADLPAELAVVGAAALGNPVGLMMLEDQDFTDPRCRTTATVLRAMIRDRRVLDPVQLASELQRRGLMRGNLSHGFIANLASPDVTPSASAAGFYAEAVRTATRMRLTALAAERLVRATGAEGASDDLAELIAHHAAELGQLPPPLDGAVPEDPQTIADVLGMEFIHDWLIPGLMGRGERAVVVSGEGSGKSVLITQFAIAIAAGCHPFTGERRGEPKRVLLIDTENGLQQTQRRYQWVGERFVHAVPGWAHNIHAHIRTEGLDLAKKDRGWLMKVAADCSPDLIIVGPAYKLMAGDPQRDSDVLGLLSALDEARTAHNAAVLVETHAPHGSDAAGSRIVRPYGSSVWLRWPEIGLGLKRGPADQGASYVTEFQVDHWRGQREERDWPELLERGVQNQMPWSPVDSGYWETARRKAAGL